MGTGSTKGVLVDTSGAVLASETVAHSMDLPRPGWAEVDAEAYVVARGLRHQRQADGRDAVGSRRRWLCVSGVGPCLVLCDDDLRPLRPAILYGIDTRATAEIDSLTEEFGGRHDTGAGRHAAVEPGGRAEAGVGAPPRARGVRARDRLVRVQLLHRGQAHRRIRAWITTPPASAIRSTSRADSTGITRMGTAHLRPSAAAAAGLAERSRRHRARRRRRSDRDSGGHARWSRARSTRTRRRSRWASAIPATRC